MINLLESVNRERNQGNAAFRLYDSERSVKDLIDSDQFREDEKKRHRCIIFQFEKHTSCYRLLLRYKKAWTRGLWACLQGTNLFSTQSI